MPSAERQRRKRVTIAVVSWNTRGLLAQCLHSLRADAQQGLAEVWVVDNGSSDGSAELVREHFSWVRLVASPENLGFGGAVNVVARQAQTEWLAAANADIRMAAGALETLLERADSHPRAGAVAPRLVLPDGSTQHSVYPFPTIPFTLAYVTGSIARSKRLSRRWCIGPGFDASREQRVPWAVGAFLLLRTEAWRAVGGFDERQWMYAEDLDLGWRLRNEGWHTWYVPQAVVYHDESAAAKQAWGSERYARWHTSTYAWMARRQGYPRTRLIAAINVGAFLVRWLAGVVRTRAGDRSSHQASVEAKHAAFAHLAGLRRRSTLDDWR